MSNDRQRLSGTPPKMAAKPKNTVQKTKGQGAEKDLHEVREGE